MGCLESHFEMSTLRDTPLMLGGTEPEIHQKKVRILIQVSSRILSQEVGLSWLNDSVFSDSKVFLLWIPLSFDHNGNFPLWGFLADRMQPAMNVHPTKTLSWKFQGSSPQYDISHVRGKCWNPLGKPMTRSGPWQDNSFSQHAVPSLNSNCSKKEKKKKKY